VHDEISARVDSRLGSVAEFFSAADLLMTTVLRVLRDIGNVASRPVPPFTRGIAPPAGQCVPRGGAIIQDPKSEGRPETCLALLAGAGE